jgi:hypothetical protein
MAKKNDNGVNKSEEIRQLLKATPQITPKEVVATLAGKGIEVSPALFYFVKGQIKGRKARRTKSSQNTVTRVVESTHVARTDAVTTILKVKAWAKEVGGMKNLKALVEALSD